MTRNQHIFFGLCVYLFVVVFGPHKLSLVLGLGGVIVITTLFFLGLFFAIYAEFKKCS